MIIPNQSLASIADTCYTAIITQKSTIYLKDNQGIVIHPKTVVIAEQVGNDVRVVRWVRNVVGLCS